MDFKIFPLLSTRSKRSITRRYNVERSGKRTPHHYTPKKILIDRLSEQLRMNPNEVRKQIAEERLFLLREIYGENEISLKDV